MRDPSLTCGDTWAQARRRGPTSGPGRQPNAWSRAWFSALLSKGLFGVPGYSGGELGDGHLPETPPRLVQQRKRISSLPALPALSCPAWVPVCPTLSPVPGCSPRGRKMKPTESALAVSWKRSYLTPRLL